MATTPEEHWRAKYEEMVDRYTRRNWPFVFWSRMFTIGFVMSCLLAAAMPQYMVWQQTLAGKAKLREAEWSRQVAVEEAKALKESAEHVKDAEIIRATGVAEANAIIGESLKDNEAYLRWRWIEGLQTNDMQVIYVPTEANLPILEAGKR